MILDFVDLSSDDELMTMIMSEKKTMFLEKVNQLI